MNKTELLQFYKKHLEQVLFPFWVKALDHQNGGIYTCFNNTGDTLLSKDKYTWSQGRYLWLSSKITKMITDGYLSEQSGLFYHHASKTARFIEDNAFMDNGNCAFLLTESGKKKEPVPGEGFDTSIFSDCFIVLGLSEFARLSNDLNRFETALNLHGRIVERFTSGDIRSEPYPVPVGYRAHSFSMIMLNITQNLADVAKSLHHPTFDKLRMESIDYMDDIMQNYYQADHSVVEMLPINSEDKNSLLCRHVNPGHVIESMWFVMQTALQSGNNDYIQKASRAVEKAISIGWDIDYGGIFRYSDNNGGKPAGNKNDTTYENLILDTWDTKLWWPHSEALYATLLSYRLTGMESMIELHNKIQNYVFNTFPNPDHSIGEWIQIRNREGKPLDKLVALPVKDPFHILRNLLLIIELLDDSKSIKRKSIV